MELMRQQVFLSTGPWSSHTMNEEMHRDLPRVSTKTALRRLQLGGNCFHHKALCTQPLQ